MLLLKFHNTPSSLQWSNALVSAGLVSCKNTLLQVKVWDSTFYLSKSTEVLSLTCSYIAIFRCRCRCRNYIFFCHFLYTQMQLTDAAVRCHLFTKLVSFPDGKTVDLMSCDRLGFVQPVLVYIVICHNEK